MTIQDIGVIIAVTLSLLSFGRTVWNTYRNRPRLELFSKKINIESKQDEILQPIEWCQIIACNFGFRPIMLKEFSIVAESSRFTLGFYDPVKATYGIREQKLPQIINPGKTCEFNINTIAAIKKQVKEYDKQLMYLFFTDSFNKKHYQDTDSLLFELGITQEYKRPKIHTKLIRLINREYFMFKRRFFGKS